jgi:sulfite reductase (NADPH) hemoprotein beta-component
VGEAEIMEILEPLLVDYAKLRHDGEHFGDFLIRHEVVAPVLAGHLFHETDAKKLRAHPTPSGTFDIYW